MVLSGSLCVVYVWSIDWAGTPSVCAPYPAPRPKENGGYNRFYFLVGDIDMRDCTACGKAKDESEFYKSFSRCKDCVSVYQKAYRAKRNASKPADWKQKTKDKKAYQQAWLSAHPGYGTQAKREWWQKNKDKLKVRWAYRDALKSGKLVKMPCFVCGELEVDGHHASYSLPLGVTWLCKEHHKQLHREHKAYE